MFTNKNIKTVVYDLSKMSRLEKMKLAEKINKPINDILQYNQVSIRYSNNEIELIECSEKEIKPGKCIICGAIPKEKEHYYCSFCYYTYIKQS